jgi:oxygen-independent coproporphyrinogen-3 oxidase
MDVLEDAGFEHYEISNFAKPGFRCRHNQVYWANHAYFGFGVGAARYLDGVRELNTRDLRTYIKRLQARESPTFQSECLPPRDRAIETIAVQLRRADGIERASFAEQTGFVLDNLVGLKIHALVEQGFLRENGEIVRLTRKGKCVADSIIEQLMQAAQ